MRFLFVAILLLVAEPVQAKEIAGVMVQEMIKTDSGAELTLNGAGIRSKFFFDIYIAELYLEEPSSDVEKILASDGSRRMVMHFLYKEVGKDKIVDGWNEGFAANSDPQIVTTLQSKIDSFNEMFVDMKEGDRIELDYVPGKGTVVYVAGSEKGIIEGKEFNDALMLIWLGKKPVASKLKEQLLSYSN